MGTYIVKLNGYAGPRYLEWSSVVDAPITVGMSLEDFTEFMRVEHGERYMRLEHDRRMERVERVGTSCMTTNVDGLIESNRAGPEESHFTALEIYREYCATGVKHGR